MPYTKQKQIPFVEIRRLLLGYELHSPELAAVIRKGKETARKRLASPGDLTLSELALICRNGHIPADEIRNAIKF